MAAQRLIRLVLFRPEKWSLTNRVDLEWIPRVVSAHVSPPPWSINGLITDLNKHVSYKCDKFHAHQTLFVDPEEAACDEWVNKTVPGGKAGALPVVRRTHILTSFVYSVRTRKVPLAHTGDYVQDDGRQSLLHPRPVFSQRAHYA